MRPHIHPHNDASTHVGEGREIGTESLRDGFRTPAPPYELRLELQMIPPVLTTDEGRERLAELIVRGNGNYYTREEIKVRIKKVMRRIERKMREAM